MWTHALGRRGGYGAAFDETEKAKGAARLFDVWKRMLEVKYEHDVQQQDPIRYKGFDIDGSLLHIHAEIALGPEHQSGRKNGFQRVSSHVATDSNKRGSLHQSGR